MNLNNLMAKIKLSADGRPAHLPPMTNGLLMIPPVQQRVAPNEVQVLATPNPKQQGQYICFVKA